MDFDTAAFHDFEVDGWADVGEAYASSDIVLGLTGQAASAMVDSAAVGAHDRVLDLACGPGLASEAARQRGATVTGVDVAAPMLDAARRRVPDGDFHQAPAEQLPFGDASFDVALCGFGLPHFAEPEAVFSETQRVLAPGGRLAFTTWCPPDQVPFFGIVFGAVVEHGSLDVDIPDGPDMFRFAVESEAVETLSRLGFSEVTVTTIPLTARLDQPSDAIDLLLKSTVRTRSLVEAQTPEARAAITDAVVDAVAAHQDGDELVVPMPAVLIAATAD